MPILPIVPSPDLICTPDLSSTRAWLELVADLRHAIFVVLVDAHERARCVGRGDDAVALVEPGEAAARGALPSYHTKRRVLLGSKESSSSAGGRHGDHLVVRVVARMRWYRV